jgi:hypothetical protein
VSEKEKSNELFNSLKVEFLLHNIHNVTLRLLRRWTNYCRLGKQSLFNGAHEALIISAGRSKVSVFEKVVHVESRYSDGLRAGRPGFYSWQGQDSILRSVQTDSGAHPASCPVGTGDKAAGAWSWPSPSIAEVKRGGAIRPLPFMSWWRCA